MKLKKDWLWDAIGHAFAAQTGRHVYRPTEEIEEDKEEE